MDKSDRIIITGFTDPICTWCWGSEPIYRKLETHYPNEIEFRTVMGGLVTDINDFYDSANEIGGHGAAAANKEIVAHWLEASKRHGMPVESEGFALFSDEYPSTYPQNIAVKAAQKIDEHKARLFLRRLREASAAEAQQTSSEEVMLKLAKEVGLDTDKFTQYINDGSAKGAFSGDLAINQTLGVTGYPTTEVKFNQQRLILRGYHPFEHYVDAINRLTGGTISPIKPERNLETIDMLMENTPRLAFEEIRQAFDFDTPDEAQSWIDSLVSEGTIHIEPAGNSYFVVKNK